jgi:hypothetical protein
MSEKITLVISLWIIFVLLVTGNQDTELFLILIFIGILIIKGITDNFSTTDIKDRLNLFIYMFMIVFIIIIGKKIIGILAI